MNPLALSDDFLTMALWIIIGIFWFVAQIFQARQRRKAGEDPGTPPDATPAEGQAEREAEAAPSPSLAGNMEDEIRNFWEEITGASAEEEESSAWRAAAPEPEPEPAPAPLPPPPLPDPKRVPIKLTPANMAPAPDEHAAAYLGGYSAIEAIEPIAEVGDMLEMEEMQFELGEITPNIVGPSNLLVGLGALRMPMVRIPIQTIDTAMTTPIKPPPLRGPGNLQRAILSRIVLGPPKALRNELEDLRDPSRS